MAALNTFFVGTTTWVVLGIVALVLILLIVFVIGTYNKLVRKRMAVKNAWAQIDVQLKTRMDLIPNLVETVKGYAGHESETFTAITQARANAGSARNIKEAAAADAEMTSAISRLLVTVEAYPQLKADANFMDLQRQLQAIEGKIAVARQFYNDSVRIYNTARAIFPTVIIAGMLGFSEEQFFEAPIEARTAPTVSFKK